MQVWISIEIQITCIFTWLKPVLNLPFDLSLNLYLDLTSNLNFNLY